MYFEYQKIGFPEFLKKHKADYKKSRFMRDFTTLITRHIKTYDSKYVACLAFDGDTARIIAYGTPEKEEFDCIFKYLEEKNFLNGCAIDVGAHYGIHSLTFSKHFERVFSFEPNPVIFRLTDFNVAYNNPRENIRLFHCALSSKEGRMELFDYKDGNTGGATLEMRHVKDPPKPFLFWRPGHGGATLEMRHVEDPATRYKYECDVRKLDDIKEIAQEKIGLLKIDTEGHEYDVLQGAQKLIARDKPVILMEDWDSRNGVESKTIKLLRENGYKHFLIPASFPEKEAANDKAGALVGKVKYLMAVLKEGKQYGLQECTFSSPKGYDLILAHP